MAAQDLQHSRAEEEGFRERARREGGKPEPRAAIHFKSGHDLCSIAKAQRRNIWGTRMRVS